MTLVKRIAGKAMWHLSNRSLLARSALRDLGLRIKPGWIGPAVAYIPFSGKPLLLTSIHENYLTFQLFWYGWTFYEPETARFLKEIAPSLTVFVDVGSNIGFLSLVAGLTNPGLRCFSFEPNPKLYRILVENAQINEAPITAENVAVSCGTGTRALYLANSDMSASLESDFSGEAVRSECSTQTVTLDDYFGSEKYRDLDLSNGVLKIDVEGHEESVLQGARATLAKHGPEIILEVLKPFSEECEAGLKMLGYRFFHMTTSGFRESSHLVPNKQDRYILFNMFLTRKRSQEDLDRVFAAYAGSLASTDFASTSILTRPEAE
ncbi:MAG: FkbM family methyltransferase [Candidatus Hydrogenedentes bacterium]|nr:FkbM family methyltransferase [Candidatus Hydrogenedentota bacterium]